MYLIFRKDQPTTARWLGWSEDYLGGFPYRCSGLQELMKELRRVMEVGMRRTGEPYKNFDPFNQRK